MPRQPSSYCIEKMIKIGLASPITYNENGFPSEFKCSHPFFHPTCHLPPTNPNDDINMSPVEGKHLLHVVQCKIFSA